MGDRERAIREFMAVNDPAGAFNNLGVVYMSQKNWIEARDAFRRAVALDPKHEKAQTNLAEAEDHLPPPAVVNLPALKDATAAAPIPPKTPVLIWLALERLAPSQKRTRDWPWHTGTLWNEFVRDGTKKR